MLPPEILIFDSDFTRRKHELKAIILNPKDEEFMAMNWLNREVRELWLSESVEKEWGNATCYQIGTGLIQTDANLKYLIKFNMIQNTFDRRVAPILGLFSVHFMLNDIFQVLDIVCHIHVPGHAWGGHEEQQLRSS